MTAHEHPAAEPVAFEDDTRAGLSLVPVAEGVHLFITEPGPGGKTAGFCLTADMIPDAVRELCEMAGVPVPVMPGLPDPGGRELDLFAENLKRLRRASGLTSNELGALAGTGGSTVRAIEGRHRNPSLRTALALAGVLGTDPTSMTREAGDGCE